MLSRERHDEYVYPVVFTAAEEGGFSVYAPDFPGCVTDADDFADGLSKIREGLCGMIYIMERDGKPIPEPSAVNGVKHEEGDVVSLIDVPIERYRRVVGSKAVRRTISLPQWLDEMAAKANVSLSQVTRDALLQRLEV